MATQANYRKRYADTRPSTNSFNAEQSINKPETHDSKIPSNNKENKSLILILNPCFHLVVAVFWVAGVFVQKLLRRLKIPQPPKIPQRPCGFHC